MADRRKEVAEAKKKLRSQLRALQEIEKRTAGPQRSGYESHKERAAARQAELSESGRDIGDLPPRLIERLQHYFATYKLTPGQGAPVSVRDVYGAQRAAQVVEAAIADYARVYPGPIPDPLGGA